MAKFKRGIENQKFIDALNKLFSDKSSFWYNMVNDQDLFIAIRDEYLMCISMDKVYVNYHTVK